MLHNIEQEFVAGWHYSKLMTLLSLKQMILHILTLWWRQYVYIGIPVDIL